MVAFRGNRLLEEFFRLVRASLFGEKQPELVSGLGIPGIDFKRPAEHFLGLVRAAKLHVGLACVDQGEGDIGFERQGFFEALRRGSVVAFGHLYAADVVPKLGRVRLEIFRGI